MKTYLRHKIVNVVDVKELFALEYLDFEGKYKDYVEKHDFWELCYVEKGQIDLVGEEQSCTVSEGEIVLIEPNRSHAYFSQNGNANKTFVICFECSSQALKPLSGKLFSATKEQIDCLEKIIEESKHTFFMSDSDLLEIVPVPNFGGQQAILIHLEYLLICLIRRASVGEDLGVVFCVKKSFTKTLRISLFVFFKNTFAKNYRWKIFVKR